MKVLVTGGAGYLGSVLVYQLINKGLSVRVFDKFYFGKESLKPYLGRIEIMQGDIRNFHEALDDVKVVIHLGGLSNDPTAEFRPRENMEINTKATIELAKACLEKKINKFIFGSTASIYDKGLMSANIIQDENSLVEPLAAYSVSKFEAEKALLELMKENDNFCPVILRKGTLYGYSPRMRYDLVVNTLVKDAFTKGRLKAFCGGNQWRPLVDVLDAARAYMVCLEADENKVKGEIFNVAYGNFQIMDVAHRIKEALKNIRPVEVDIDYTPGKIDRSYSISNEKLEDRLKFRYKVTIEDSARNMAGKIKDFLDKGGNVSELENNIYYNIRWMQHLADMESKIKEMGGSVF